VPIVALSLPLVCAPAPAPAGRSAQPPWGRDSPHWRRGEQQLPQDHRARRVDRAADLLDLSVLFAAYAGTGSLAHRPDLPLKAVLYEAPRGRLSPAQWHQDLLTDEACQWLARGLRPSRPRLYALRDRLGPVLDRRHDALIGAAVGEGLSDASQAALGGSAVAANASRHRLRNEPTLAKRQQALEEAVGADQAGAPPAGAPAWRAATPRGRRGQRRRYRRAHEQLTARRQQNRRRPASKRRADKDVRSGPADPEAAVGLDELKVFRPLYTVQLMPDLNTPLVLAYDVFAQAGDAATLPAMLGRCRRAAGRYPADLLSDSAYAKALGLACCPAGATKGPRGRGGRRRNRSPKARSWGRSSNRPTSARRATR
jgi:transposase